MITPVWFRTVNSANAAVPQWNVTARGILAWMERGVLATLARLAAETAASLPEPECFR